MTITRFDLGTDENLEDTSLSDMLIALKDETDTNIEWAVNRIMSGMFVVASGIKYQKAD